MAKLQSFLTDEAHQWLHPSERRLIARNVKLGLFVTLTMECDKEDEWRMCLNVEMQRGTSDSLDALFREVSALLIGDIVNEDAQLDTTMWLFVELI